MKDKKRSETSINDLVNQHRQEDGNPKAKQISMEHEAVQAEVFTQSELESIAQYNNNITTIDDLYGSIKPLNKVLVRVFLLEPSKSENGLLSPQKQILPVSTNSGVGTLMEIESPYPYSNKAIVVASPGLSTVKRGDIVQLESAPVRVNGAGHNAVVVIPNAYLHPDANTTIVSTDPGSKHYGYLLIPSHEISVIL